MSRKYYKLSRELPSDATLWIYLYKLMGNAYKYLNVRSFGYNHNNL